MKFLGCFAACFGEFSDCQGSATVKPGLPLQCDCADDNDIAESTSTSRVTQEAQLRQVESKTQSQTLPSPPPGPHCGPNQQFRPDISLLQATETQSTLASGSDAPGPFLASGWGAGTKPQPWPTEGAGAPRELACHTHRLDKVTTKGLSVDVPEVPGLAGASDVDERDPIFDDPDGPESTSSSPHSPIQSRSVSKCSLDTNPHVGSISSQSMATLATQQIFAAATGTSRPFHFARNSVGGVHSCCAGTTAAMAATTAAAGEISVSEEPAFTQFSRHCSSSSLHPMPPVSQVPFPLLAPLPASSSVPSPPRLLSQQQPGSQCPRLTVFPSLAAMVADLHDLRLLRPAAAAAANGTGRDCNAAGYTCGRCVLVKGRLANGAPVVVNLLGCRALHPATGPALRTVMLAGSAVHPAIARVHGMRFVPAAGAQAPGGLAGATRPPGAVEAAAGLRSAQPPDWGRDEPPTWLPAAGHRRAQQNVAIGRGCTGEPCPTHLLPSSSSAAAPLAPAPRASISHAVSACCSATATSAVTLNSTATATSTPLPPAEWPEPAGATVATSVGCNGWLARECQLEQQHALRHYPQQQQKLLFSQPQLQQPQDRDTAVQQGLTAMVPPCQQLAAVVATLQTQLQLLPGEGILAVLCEGSPMGTLESLLGGAHNPFRSSRSWPAYMARRALLRTALEVAGALVHLHSSGFVHGALRPCNVLLVPSSSDRRNFRAKIFGASVRFAKLLGSRNSAATLTATGDNSASLDARSQGPGASSSVAVPGVGRSSSSPQPHISAGLTWPEPVPGPGGQALVPSYGTSTPVCAAAATPASVSSTACSLLPSTTSAWWSHFSAAPNSPASAQGRSRPPSRVLTVAEEDLSFSAVASAGNYPLDLPATAAGITGSIPGSGSSRRRPSGSVLSPSLMLAMISCPGRAMTSAGGSGGVPPLCRTPSEGQLLAGPSFFRASRRPLRTSYAIPEHLEVEGTEAPEAAAEAEAGALSRAGDDGDPADPATGTMPARRSHSDLVLRSAAEVAGGNCSGKASLSFTWGAAGTADGAPATGPGAPVGSGGGGTSSRLAGLIRALVFNKPGSTAGTAGPTPGLESSPSAVAGSGTGGNSVGGLGRRISNARGGGGTTPSSIRTSSVALAAAALLSRRPSWRTANSPVSSSTAQENETSEALWTPEQQQQQPQQQERSHHRRRHDQQEQEDEAEGHQDTAEDEDEVEVALFGGGTCAVTPPSPSRFHRGRVLGRGHGAAGGGAIVTQSHIPSLEQLPSESLPISVGLDNPSESLAVPSVHRTAARAAAATAVAATPAASTAAAGKVPTISSTSGGGWRDELFLPPESQQDPLCRVDASHDTWAFGMLLWAMAAGEPPTEGQIGPGGALTYTSALCPPMGMLSTLELDLGIRAPAWPASCRTHSHLQSLYEACITKEPGSRPSMVAVRTQLEWLERQLREEHFRSRAAATAAALNGFMLLDDQHQRHARHNHSHNPQQQQQQRSPPRTWQQGQAPITFTGYGATSDALQQLQQQQQNQMLPNGRRTLMRMVHGDLIELWGRPRGPPPPSLPHPRPHGYVPAHPGPHPPGGLPGGLVSQPHDPNSQLFPYSQQPQKHPLPTLQQLQQQHLQQQRQRQQTGEQQQGQQQEQQQQQRGWPVGLSKSLPTPMPYMYAQGVFSPL